MGQGNHMAHAADSRSNPANSILLHLILIVLKDCRVHNANIFHHHPSTPNACSSLPMSQPPSFLTLLPPLLGLLTLGLSYYLVLPQPASFLYSLEWGTFSWDCHTLTDGLLHSFILPFLNLSNSNYITYVASFRKFTQFGNNCLTWVFLPPDPTSALWGPSLCDTIMISALLPSLLLYRVL